MQLLQSVRIPSFVFVCRKIGIVNSIFSRLVQKDRDGFVDPETRAYSNSQYLAVEISNGKVTLHRHLSEQENQATFTAGSERNVDK
ncbi:hypothetical protein DTL21_02870 [Bremerella cremea]|uniref:Uncharacterized protein n=1 Tax=Blastopirellula marina TaxID=124 RepID=A0A2S8G5H3_9BACT|nr:hypothetical protein C5Y83_02870 [Blastopirellula marina]RCS51172.1 hypothetical protein DTL21_02870 [Bremerella cremea]